jgi:RHS repeat-associated protein
MALIRSSAHGGSSDAPATEYISTNGVTDSHYEYSPFGEIVVQLGELADSFNHRFSTKPWCEVTGLSEYLFRKYESGMGRWLNRDPLGETADVSLYSIANNGIINSVDPHGLWALQNLHGPIHEAYSSVLEQDFIAVKNTVMPDLTRKLKHGRTKASSLPKKCEYKETLIEGLERLSETLEGISEGLKSERILRLHVSQWFPGRGEYPIAFTKWNWGTWEITFNLNTDGYFNREPEKRYGTLFHELIHIEKGNNFHLGYWNNPHVLDQMVYSGWDSFVKEVINKMVAESGEKCCPQGANQWPNN